MSGKKFAMIIVETSPELTLEELCEACHISSETVLELVEMGALMPTGVSLHTWRFAIQDVYRARRLRRLQRDLEVNLSGAALAMDLIDQIQELRSQVEWLKMALSFPPKRE